MSVNVLSKSKLSQNILFASCDQLYICKPGGQFDKRMYTNQINQTIQINKQGMRFCGGTSIPEVYKF